MNSAASEAGVNVDTAVHATELKQKVGGSVVVPQDGALPEISLTDVQVEGADPSKPQLELLFNSKLCFTTTFVIVVGVITWCAYFMKPRRGATDYYDAKNHTISDVMDSMESRDRWIGLVRIILSHAVGGCIETLLAALYAPEIILTNDRAMSQSWMFLLKGIPYAVELPFSGFNTQFGTATTSVAISLQDLGKYDMVLNPEMGIEGLEDMSLIGSEGSMSSSIDVMVTNATQANFSVSFTPSTTETILRRTMLPPRTQVRRCSINNSQHGNEYTNVAYDFMINDWLPYVLPEGINPVKNYAFPALAATNAAVTDSSLNTSEVTFIQSLFTRAAFLYADAALNADSLQDGSNGAALEQLKQDTISYAIENATTDQDVPGLHNYVRNYFENFAVWQDVLHANVSEIGLEYSTFDLTERIHFTSITLSIPLNNTFWYRELAEINGELIEQTTAWPGSGDLIYEIDVANECGPRSCGIQNRGLAPEPKIVAFGDCSKNGGFDCSGETKNSSMWIAGFGRRIEGDELELLGHVDPKLRKAILRNPREYHKVTMGYLTFDMEDLAHVYNARCDAPSCLGLHYPFSDPITNQSSVLIVGFANTPMIDFGSSFDLFTNSVRGRQLVTRYTTGARIEYEVLQPRNIYTYNWSEDIRGENCSGRMERSIITYNLNNLFIEDPVQTTYTAGLFFLFQDAQLTKQIISSGASSQLDFLGNGKVYTVSYVVSQWQAWFSICFGAIILFLLVWSFKQEKKKIVEHTSRLLHHPKLLLRALNDPTAFPSKFIAVKATLPSEKGKSIILGKLGISSVTFGPIPAQEGISASNIVIQQESIMKDITK